MSIPFRPLVLGSSVAVVAMAAVFVFADAFHDGATWSPVHQNGGPGFVFVVGPALAGWFGIASWVRRNGSSAIFQVLWFAALAAVPVAAVGIGLGLAWPDAPAVLESLFSTTGVALIVSAVAAVSVRIASESIEE